MSEQDLINIRKEKHAHLGGEFPLADSQLNIDVALDLFNYLDVPISLEVEELKEFYRNLGSIQWFDAFSRKNYIFPQKRINCFYWSPRYYRIDPVDRFKEKPVKFCRSFQS